MMCRSLVVCLVLSLLPTACGVPGVDDQAQVVVEGRIMVPPNAPYANSHVFLHRSNTWLEGFFEWAYFPWYWLDCVLDELDNPGSCGAWMTDISGDDGTYRFSFTGASTRNEIEQLLDFQISAVRGAGRESEIALIRFDVRQEVLSFPALTFWNQPPAATYSASQVVLDWTETVVFGSQPPDTVDLVFVPDDGGLLSRFSEDSPIWRVDGVEDQLVALDVRLFQDAEVAYRASDFTQQSLLSTTVQIQRTSPVGQLAAQNHVPASRDATCLYATGLGSRTVQPCALTDGDFRSFFTGDATTCVVAAGSDSWPECAAASFEELTVALDHAVDAPTLFLYEFGGGSTTGVTLSVSEDGTTFAPISSDLISFSVHHIAQPVRFIRFRREIAAQAPAAGGMRWFLSEVGIFR